MRETWKVAANLDLRVGGNDVSVETPVTRRGGERGGGMESGCSGQRPEGREAGVARGPNEGVGPGLPAGVAGGTHLCELPPLYCKGLVSGWCGFCTMLSLEGGGAKHAGSPENGGGWECSPGLRRKPGRNGSASQTMGTARPGLDPRRPGPGRDEMGGWRLVLSRSSPHVRPRGSGEGCTESREASASPDVPCARGEGGARGWRRGLDKRWAGLGSRNEESTAAWSSRRRWASDGDPARMGMTRAAWSRSLRLRAGSRTWPWSGVRAQDAQVSVCLMTS